MKKKVLLISGAILITVLLSAGSFWGGMTYQSKRAEGVRANFINSRGQGANLPFSIDGQFGAGGQGPGFVGGGGTIGEVKTIEGDTLTISTPQNVTTVIISDASEIQKSEAADISDLQPGVQVMVTGQRDAGGVITASQILILDSDASTMFNPSMTGTAP